MTKILHRIESGRGRLDDLDTLRDVGDNMLFKNFCALGDGAVSPIDSSLKYFREEYVAHVRGEGCPFDESPVLRATEAREHAATQQQVDLGKVLR
jgi:NADH-quinone oxidoreductase subunit F